MTKYNKQTKYITPGKYDFAVTSFTVTYFNLLEKLL